MCMEDVPPNDVFSMPCNHKFCLDCWGGFISTAISDGPNCVYHTCPEFKCNELITEREVSCINGFFPWFRGGGGVRDWVSRRYLISHTYMYILIYYHIYYLFIY